jgi:hypothetical protein
LIDKVNYELTRTCIPAGTRILLLDDEIQRRAGGNDGPTRNIAQQFVIEIAFGANK